MLLLGPYFGCKKYRHQQHTKKELHQPTLANGRTGGNELLRNAESNYMGYLDALLNFIQLLAMKYVVAFLVQGLFAFAQAPGQGRPSSPDASTRLLIELFKGDTNRDGRISEGEFGWPKVMFGPMDQNRDGFITANEVQSLFPRASNTRRYKAGSLESTIIRGRSKLFKW